MRYDPSTRVLPVVGGVVTLALLLRLANARSHSYSAEHVRKGGALVQQAVKWHSISRQDEDAVQAARHADYALAYLNAAREVLPDRVLEHASHVDVHALHETLDTAQRARAAALDAQCPMASGGGVGADATRRVTWTRV